MRNRLLAILLPLFMLLSQQGAAWHEIGHYSQDAQNTESTGKGFKTDAQCASCLAFAHLGAAAAPSLPTLDLADVRQSLPPATSFAIAEVFAPTPRSRGPPTPL